MIWPLRRRRQGMGRLGAGYPLVLSNPYGNGVMTPNRSNAIGRVVANWLQYYRDKGCPIRDVARDGRDHFGVWLQAQTAQNRARVQARIDRIKVGNSAIIKDSAKASPSCGSTSAQGTACITVAMGIPW